jgi:hypothetical protein
MAQQPLPDFQLRHSHGADTPAARRQHTLDGVGFVTLSELLITGFVLAPAFAEAIGGVYSRPRGAEAV